MVYSSLQATLPVYYISGLQIGLQFCTAPEVNPAYFDKKKKGKRYKEIKREREIKKEIKEGRKRKKKEIRKERRKERKRSEGRKGKK